LFSQPRKKEISRRFAQAWFDYEMSRIDDLGRYSKLPSRVAHAWGTPSPIALLPGINAQPPFSTNALNMAIAVTRYKRTTNYIQRSSSDRCGRAALVSEPSKVECSTGGLQAWLWTVSSSQL
jgi:hypothetical protein